MYHPGQKIVTCSRCLNTGHHVTACVEAVRCRQCLCSGHKQGDPQCQLAPAAPTQDNAQQSNTPAVQQSSEETAKNPAAHTKQASLTGMIQRRGRHRSATPTSGKRYRSPSLPRSPRTAGSKKDCLGKERKQNPDPVSDGHTEINTSSKESGHDLPP